MALVVASRWLLALALAVSLVLGLAGCASPPDAADGSALPVTVRDDYRPVRTQLSTLIADLRRDHGIVGLSIAVVDDQEVVWSEGFGFADAASRRTATPETVYRVASISKLLTATAVVQLAERGSIDLDERLSTYLPQFSIRTRSAGAPPITLRSLLTHHSGLPGDLTQGMWSTASFTTVAERLRTEYTAYPPNLVLSYSNLGYSLLGHMVEEASGEPFVRYMQRAVLQPLKMGRSGYESDAAMRALLSKSYRAGGEAAALPVRDLPAMGLYSNVDDLSRFMMMAFRGGSPVLSPPALAAMLEAQNADVVLDFGTRVGLGWLLDADLLPGAGRIAAHGGTTPWFSGQLMLLPDERLGVVVLANTGESRQAVGQIARQALGLALATKTGRQLPPGRAPAPPLAAGLDAAAQPVEIVGQYATDLGLLAISPSRDKVCNCLMDRTFDLVAYPDGWFGIDEFSAALPADDPRLGRLRFSALAIMGKEVIVAREGDGHVRILGEKVRPGAIPPAWRARAGKYLVLNADPGFPVEDMALHDENGVLCLSYRMPELAAQRVRVPIQAISDTEAVVLGLGRTRGETVRVTHTLGEERLHYSGYEARRRPG